MKSLHAFTKPFLTATSLLIALIAVTGATWAESNPAEPNLPSQSYSMLVIKNAALIRNSIGMEFIRIPKGTFIMGSPEYEPDRDTDEKQHQVILSKDFYLQTTEVTQEQWLALIDGNPTAFPECGPTCPVDSLKPEWIDLYITKINALEPDKNYRLPTEAEWEYAARAGTTTPYYVGNCLESHQASMSGAQQLPGCEPSPNLLQPMPVASFKPNPWGLYDMYGNAWEMCSDWYGDYDTADATNPQGPEEGKFKVIRGGSWKFSPSFARSANRFRNIRDISGFRLVVEMKQP